MPDAEATVSPAPSGRLRYWLRILRPLGWWLLLVLVLFCYHQHEELLAKTRLTFAVTMAGKKVNYDVSASLDGRPFENGGLVPLGHHLFTVSHPKAKTFSTNLSIWYGGHDFGDIALERGTGTLVVEASPPAAQILIRGPEFNGMVTNSTGFTSAVPTDRYVVEAKYQHWDETHEVTVTSGSTGILHIAPRLGTMLLESDHAGTSFEVRSSDNRIFAVGNLPATILDVPEGTYRLTAKHHGNQREETVLVRTGETNGVKVEFVYGAAVFETEPPGANVLSRNPSRNWGATPLTLAELPPGAWEFTLQRPGYELVALPMQITANQTNTFRTNLLSTSYTGAMSAAKKYMESGDYDRAAQSATEALRVKPDDAPALALQREASGLGNILRAETLGEQGDYAAGIKALQTALELLPDNEHARQLLANFEQLKAEKVEKERQERLKRPREAFDAALEHYPDAALFESHELMARKPVKEVETAIVNALREGKPAFQVKRNTSARPETFEIEAVQEFNTVLGTSSGRRLCLIVGGQTKDDETQILFKVLEYKTEAVNKFSIGNMIGTPAAVNYLPIHSGMSGMTDKQKAQLAEGTNIVTERIQGAVGQGQ